MAKKDYKSEEERAYYENYFDFIFKKSELEEMFFEFSAYMSAEDATKLTQRIQYKMLERYKKRLESNIRLFDHRLNEYAKEMKKNPFGTSYYGGCIDNLKRVKVMAEGEIKKIDEELITIGKEALAVV